MGLSKDVVTGLIRGPSLHPDVHFCRQVGSSEHLHWLFPLSQRQST